MTESNGRSAKACIKCKSAASGLKTIPTASSFSRDGLLVAAACEDGSIQMWDHRKSFVNTALHLKDAHQKSTDTSCLTFGYDNRHIASRNCGDETLKVIAIYNIPYFHPRVYESRVRIELPPKTLTLKLPLHVHSCGIFVRSENR